MKKVKTLKGKLFELNEKESIPEDFLMEIYRVNPTLKESNYNRLHKQEYVPYQEYQPFMLVEQYDNINIDTTMQRLFLIKVLTRNGIISYHLFWNKKDFLKEFRMVDK